MLHGIDIISVVCTLALLCLISFGAYKCHLIEHAGRVSKEDWVVTALILVAMTQAMYSFNVLLIPAFVFFGLAVNAVCARLGNEKYRLFFPILLIVVNPFVWTINWDIPLSYILLTVCGIFFCLSDCIYDTFTKKKLLFVFLLVLILAAMIAVCANAGMWQKTEYVSDILSVALPAVLSIALGVLYKYFSRLRGVFTVILTTLFFAGLALIQMVCFWVVNS